jgi:hypothetical protein
LTLGTSFGFVNFAGIAPFITTLDFANWHQRFLLVPFFLVPFFFPPFFGGLPRLLP